ncbi:MAG: TetR/AcrR family transcriptional regulator [Acidimicrobiales bacterium]|nr:TetR/AcrR family transcriptional regulator [Acidimicrobiales bacterium]
MSADGAVDRRAWLLAGQALLRRGGLPAVKLTALTAEVGRTTGSFYHHFPNVAAYLDDLARFYGADQVEAVLAEISARPDAADPVARLRELSRRALDDDMRPLDVAMRDWAGRSEVAAAAVRAADAALLHFVERAFRDLGFDRPGARTRALVLLSVGVARVEGPWPLPRSAPDQVIALLTRPDR